MPRYTAVAPTFTPLDYKTRIAPLEQYKEEYDKRMDALDEQGVLADAIGGLIDENQDPELARTYRDYNDKMVSTAQNLLQTGDLGSSRRALGELRRDYANKLVPIQQAYNLRAEDAKADREMHRKDPSYRSNNPLDNPLSSYMNGHMPDQFGVSGDKLYAEGLADAKAQSERVHRILQDWKVDPKLGNEWYTKRIASGYNADETAAMLAEMAGVDLDNAKTQEEIKQLSQAGQYVYDAMNRIYSANGVDNLTSDTDRTHMQGRILDGIVAGLTYKESDEEKQHDPLLGLKAEKLRRELSGGGNGEPKNTNTRDYTGQHNEEGKIIRDKIIKQFDKPIVDQKTGRIVRNGLEAYLAIKEIEDLTLDQSEYDRRISEYLKQHPELNGYDKYKDPEFIRLTAEKSRAKGTATAENKAELKRRKELYGDLALTRKEYNDIKKAVGVSDRELTIEDVYNASNNNLEYSTTPMRFHEVSNDANTPLQQNILSHIRSNIGKGDKVVYKADNDGLRKTNQGKPVRVSESTFDDKNVKAIKITPTSAANGEILIQCKDGNYLVPAFAIGNEAGSDIFGQQINEAGTTVQQYINGVLNGKEVIVGVEKLRDGTKRPIVIDYGLVSIDERNKAIEHMLDEVTLEMQNNTGRNIFQSLGKTSSK